MSYPLLPGRWRAQVRAFLFHADGKLTLIFGPVHIQVFTIDTMVIFLT